MKKTIKMGLASTKIPFHRVYSTKVRLTFILLFKQSILNWFYVFHKQQKLGNQLNWVALKTKSRETFRTCVPRF